MISDYQNLDFQLLQYKPKQGKQWILYQNWIAMLTMKHKGCINKWNLLYIAPNQIWTWNKIFYKMCLEWHLQCINKKMQLGCKSNPTLFRTFRSICITIKLRHIRSQTWLRVFVVIASEINHKLNLFIFSTINNHYRFYKH
jgi:hypothetical protein